MKSNIHDILQILRTNRSVSNSRENTSNSRENTRMLRFPSSSSRKQACFKCDKDGDFAIECPISISNSPFQSKNRSPSLQAKPLNINRLEVKAILQPT